MKIQKMLLAAGVAGLIGAATPAQATWGCWFGKCGGSSSGGTSTGGHPGGSSGGSPTPVPEPEQMGLFAMGIAVVGYRLFRARRRDK